VIYFFKSLKGLLKNSIKTLHVLRYGALHLKILLVFDLPSMFDFVEPYGVRHSVAIQYPKGVKFSILMQGFLMLLPHFHALRTLFNLAIILFPRI